jgi:hypothetical protein
MVEFLGTGLSALLLSPGEGNFTFDGIQEDQTEAVDIKNRGEHLELAKGDQVYPTGSITVYRDGPQHSAVNLTVMDAVVKRAGSAAASGTTEDEGGVVWTGSIKFTENRGGGLTVSTFPNCRLILSAAEAQSGNTMTVAWTSYGRPTFA